MRRGTFNTAGSSQRSASFGPVQAVKKTMVAPSALPSLPKTTTEGRSPNVTLSAKDIVPGLKNSKGPTSDSSTTAQKPPGIQISAKDIFRLRYLRFATTDMDATVDFYTTIGMNLDFKSEQGVWVNAGLKDKRNTTNQQQGKSKKDEEPIRLPPIATFTAKKSITGFSFRAPGSASVDPNDNIQLIFEKEIVKDDGKKKEVRTVSTLIFGYSYLPEPRIGNTFTSSRAFGTN